MVKVISWTQLSKHADLRCFKDVSRWKLERCLRFWGNRWPHWCKYCALICLFGPIYACIFRILSWKLGGLTKNKLWLVATQLFLKYALNPFHGRKKKKKKKKKKIKEKENLYFRREVKRTALSESDTQCMVVTYIAFSTKKNTKSYLLN